MKVKMDIIKNHMDRIQENVKAKRNMEDEKLSFCINIGAEDESAEYVGCSISTCEHCSERLVGNSNMHIIWTYGKLFRTCAQQHIKPVICKWLIKPGEDSSVAAVQHRLKWARSQFEVIYQQQANVNLPEVNEYARGQKYANLKVSSKPQIFSLVQVPVLVLQEAAAVSNTGWHTRGRKKIFCPFCVQELCKEGGEKEATREHFWNIHVKIMSERYPGGPRKPFLLDE